MIRLCRVDNRLIHGQVAYAWMQALTVDCILVASDSVASDELKCSILRMAKPAGVKLVIKSVRSSIEAINSGVTDKYDLLVICESVDDAFRLASGTPSINEIDLGGAKMEDGRRRIAPAFCVDEKEERQLREMVARGVHIYIQQVPGDSPEDVMNLL